MSAKIRPFLLIAALVLVTSVGVVRSKAASTEPSIDLDSRVLETAGITLVVPKASAKVTEAQVRQAIARIEPTRVKQAKTMSVRRIMWRNLDTSEEQPAWLVTLDGVNVPLHGPARGKSNTQMHIVISDDAKPILAISYR